VATIEKQPGIKRERVPIKSALEGLNQLSERENLLGFVEGGGVSFIGGLGWVPKKLQRIQTSV